MLKVGNRVTVIATVTGSPHLCVVDQLVENGWFLARVPIADGMCFGRRVEQEGVDWARGWASRAATALLAQNLLERSR